MPIEQTPSLDLVVDQLRTINPRARRKVRQAIVEATRDMREDMARRASWSSRIPGAIRLRISWRTGRVEIRVDARRAPHARPYEGTDGNAFFRHPVFGDRDRWVSQRTRPFFFPAVRAHRRRVIDAVERAVLQSIETLR